jgi:hypothetical protein
MKEDKTSRQSDDVLIPNGQDPEIRSSSLVVHERQGVVEDNLNRDN